VIIKVGNEPPAANVHKERKNAAVYVLMAYFVASKNHLPFLLLFQTRAHFAPRHKYDFTGIWQNAPPFVCKIFSEWSVENPFLKIAQVLNGFNYNLPRSMPQECQKFKHKIAKETSIYSLQVNLIKAYPKTLLEYNWGHGKRSKFKVLVYDFNKAYKRKYPATKKLGIFMPQFKIILHI